MNLNRRVVSRIPAWLLLPEKLFLPPVRDAAIDLSVAHMFKL